MQWIKSTYSNPSGNCLEVAAGETTVYVRDSKDRTVHLKVARADWEAFLMGARDGEFQDL